MKLKYLTLALLPILYLSCSSDPSDDPSNDPSDDNIETPDVTLEHYQVESDPEGYVDSSKWELSWSDEFDGDDSDLEPDWTIDDGNYKSSIASIRWRENVVVEDGVLKLLSKRDDRDSRVEWSTGNLWTTDTYQYGYFECRYKYNAAYTVNNAFWIMPSTTTTIPAGGVKFEIDINEGHYPNLLYLDLHDWTNSTVDSDGTVSYPRDQRQYVYGAEPYVYLRFSEAVTCSKIRFSSLHKTQFRIQEFKVFAHSTSGYTPIATEGTVSGNLMYSANVTAVEGSTNVSNLYDGNHSTSWLSPLDGDKWFEVDLKTDQDIGCIQFINGSESSYDSWIGMVSDYVIEGWNGTEWFEIESWDVTDEVNFAEMFHTYALEWTPDYLIYYMDGIEIRREENTICHNPANVYLSTAILTYKGEIPDNVDGAHMEVDYLRIYSAK
ncbi:MAG: family 16 glycosylhydrolase [Rikenellaceae bacterium]